MEKRVQFQKKRNRGGITNASKTKPKKVSTKWGRVKKDKKGNWTLKNKKWLGEKDIELDEFDAEKVYNQILDQKRKRGYVDYSELVV